jgi:hypothetical protein
MANSTIEELQTEIQRFRDLVISLCPALLRNIELDPPKSRRNISSGADAEHLLKEAEIYFRCSTVPGLNKAIAGRLEIAGNELMAKAVEIETTFQREKWKE